MVRLEKIGENKGRKLRCVLDAHSLPFKICLEDAPQFNCCGFPSQNFLEMLVNNHAKGVQGCQTHCIQKVEVQPILWRNG